VLPLVVFNGSSGCPLPEATAATIEHTIIKLCRMDNWRVMEVLGQLGICCILTSSCHRSLVTGSECETLPWVQSLKNCHICFPLDPRAHKQPNCTNHDYCWPSTPLIANLGTNQTHAATTSVNNREASGHNSSYSLSSLLLFTA